jgi:hypothetical protein
MLPIVGEGLVGSQDLIYEMCFTWRRERLKVVVMKREHWGSGALFTYLPKWQDRQISLLPCWAIEDA